MQLWLCFQASIAILSNPISNMCINWFSKLIEVSAHTTLQFWVQDCSSKENNFGFTSITTISTTILPSLPSISPTINIHLCISINNKPTICRYLVITFFFIIVNSSNPSSSPLAPLYNQPISSSQFTFSSPSCIHCPIV